MASRPITEGYLDSHMNSVRHDLSIEIQRAETRILRAIVGATVFTSFLIAITALLLTWTG